MVMAKSIGYVSMGVVQAVFGVIVGFVLGILELFGFAALGSSAGGVGVGAVVGIISLIVSVIGGAIGGFIGGIIFALIYNYIIVRVAKLEVQ